MAHRSIIETTLKDAGAIRFAEHHQRDELKASKIAAEAVARAIALRKMASSVRENGFQAVPLDSLLVNAAEDSGVPVANVLPSRTHNESLPLQRWVSLARQVGVAAEQLQLSIRAWFAEFTVDSPMSVRARSSEGNPAREVLKPSTPEAFAHSLNAIERNYTPAQRGELASILETA